MIYHLLGSVQVFNPKVAENLVTWLVSQPDPSTQWASTNIFVIQNAMPYVPFLNHLQTFSWGIEIGHWCEKGKTTKLLPLSDFEINKKVFGKRNEEYFAPIWRIKFQFSSEWYFLYCTQFLRLGKLLLYFEVCLQMSFRKLYSWPSKRNLIFQYLLKLSQCKRFHFDNNKTLAYLKNEKE